MELYELNDLEQQYNFPLEKLRLLADKYPSARKDFVEQVLAYVKNHGMGFSYVMNMMEMDTAFLLFLGISRAERFAGQKVAEAAEA